MIPYTCPLIDHVLEKCRAAGILEEVEEQLEELRDWHKVLRFEAARWQSRYNTLAYGEVQFNPEVLPPCLPSKF